MQISDEGDRIRIHVAEYNIQRVIHLEPVEPPAEASHVGHSLGRWDGDTLVVTTTGVDWPYYSEEGTPQSDQVSYVERLSTSSDGNTLNYSITITDPVVFVEPLTMERTREWMPGYEIPPYNCIPEWEEGAGA